MPDEALVVAHALPGRVRLRVERLRGHRPACAYIELRLAGEHGIDRVEAQAGIGSVTISYDPTVYTQGNIIALFRRLLPEALVRQPGHAEIARVRDIPPGHAGRIPALLLPTLAVAAAATEALPAVLFAGVLSLASLRIAARAAEGARAGQLNVDQLDAANVVLVALQGNPLAASAITWLIALQETVRGKALRSARANALDAVTGAGPRTRKPDEHERRARIDLANSIPLSDTRLQYRSARASDVISKPLLILGAARMLFTRDPGALIDTVKPGSDFQSGVRFAGPVTVTSGVSGAAREGALILGGKAMERLAGIDTIVADLHGTPYERALFLLNPELERRGITHVEVLGTRGLAGRHPSRDGERLVEGLRRKGRRVAVIGTPRTPEHLYAAAGLAVCTGMPRGETADLIDVVLFGKDLTALIHARDVAMHTCRAQHRSTVLVGAATFFNFIGSFLGLVPAPVGTAITTSAVMGVAGNAGLLRRSAGRPIHGADPDRPPRQPLADSARSSTIHPRIRKQSRPDSLTDKE